MTNTQITSTVVDGQIRCCPSGKHTTTCELFLTTVDACRKAHAVAEAAKKLQAMWPATHSEMASRLDFVTKITATVPQGLVGLLYSLGTEGES